MAKIVNTKNLIIAAGMLIITTIVAVIVTARKKEADVYVVLNEQTGMYESQES